MTDNPNQPTPDDQERGRLEAELERLRQENQRLRDQQANNMAGVTRNVPPMRARVNPGHTITYAGQSYSNGDELLHADGPTIQSLEMLGLVSVVERDARDAFNGKEGDGIRKRLHAQYPDGDPHEHTHKFAPADKHGNEVDVTSHRQRIAAQHVQDGTTMSDEEAGL